MKKSIGVAELLSKKFDAFDFEGKWQDALGDPERNFRCLIYGRPGHGKTEFCMQFAKYLAGFTKVYYNTYEQGVSKSLQCAAQRNDLDEVAGKLIFGNKDTFEEMVERLSSRNSPSVCIIDSRDYMNLTGQQYKMLDQKFPRKAFIVVCWESAGKPKGEHAKAIEFMADIKIHVSNFIAHPRSRYGGHSKYVIWDRKKPGQLF